MKLIIVIAIFITLFGLVEMLQRRAKVEHALTRKIAHISSGLITFFLPNFLNAQQIIVLAIIFTVLLGISKYFGLLSSIHKINRRTLGEVYFPLGVGISAFFFLPNDILAFQFGILVLAFADALAGIIGDTLEKHQIPLLENGKSLEGSATFFLTTFFIGFFISSKLQTSFSITTMLTVATFVTVIESILVFGLDNLLLPLTASYIFKILVL